METTAKIRMDILIEAPFRQRLSETLDRHGVSGYTIFHAIGGRGGEGEWSRTGQITDMGQMMLFTCILDQSTAEVVLDELSRTMAEHIGYVTTSDVRVIRPRKFT